MKYKCVKSFSSSNADEYGFLTEGYTVIECGTSWTLNNDYVPRGINHLDSAHKWVEITDEFLKSHFEPVKDGE